MAGKLAVSLPEPIVLLDRYPAVLPRFWTVRGADLSWRDAWRWSFYCHVHYEGAYGEQFEWVVSARDGDEAWVKWLKGVVAHKEPQLRIARLELYHVEPPRTAEEIRELEAINRRFRRENEGLFQSWREWARQHERQTQRQCA